MNDDTRKLLKVFGVAVTDAEAEAERLAGTAARLSSGTSKEEPAKLLQDASDLCRALLGITQQVFAIQRRLHQQLAEAGARLQAPDTSQSPQRQPDATETREFELQVPGVWYARRLDDASSDLTKVAISPGKLLLQAEMAYRFEASRSATDDDLAGLSRLPAGLRGLVAVASCIMRLFCGCA